MIHCGSGSYYGSRSGSVPALDPDIQTLFSAVFNKIKFAQNLAFSMSEVALFPGKLASHF
jgi:hypothetical protein